MLLSLKGSSPLILATAQRRKQYLVLQVGKQAHIDHMAHKRVEPGMELGPFSPTSGLGPPASLVPSLQPEPHL